MTFTDAQRDLSGQSPENTWVNPPSAHEPFCRRHGHAWSPGTALRYRRWLIRREYRHTQTCVGCGTERIRVMSKRGKVLSSTLVYPPGYLKGDLR